MSRSELDHKDQAISSLRYNMMQSVEIDICNSRLSTDQRMSSYRQQLESSRACKRVTQQYVYLYIPSWMLYAVCYVVCQLQSVCADLAQCLGCSVEGVAAESVRDVLNTRAHSVLQDRQNLQQQVRIHIRTLRANVARLCINYSWEAARQNWRGTREKLQQPTSRYRVWSPSSSSPGQPWPAESQRYRH